MGHLGLLMHRSSIVTVKRSKTIDIIDETKEKVRVRAF